MTTPNRRSNSRSAQLIKILREHAELMTKDATLAEILRQLVHGACLLADCEPRLGLIRVIDPDKQVSRQDVLADGTVFRPAANAGVSVMKGVIGRVIQRREPEIVDNEVAVPLVIGNRCWGALNLKSVTPNHFRRSLIPWLETIAQQAALAIQHGDLRERERRTRFEHAARRSGVDPENLRNSLNNIVAEALKSLPGLGASVELLAYDQEDNVLVTLAYATKNRHGSLPGRFAPRSTFAWKAFEERQVIAIPQVADHDSHTSVSGSHAVLAIPLFQSNEQGHDVLGVLNVEAPKPQSLDKAYRAYIDQTPTKLNKGLTLLSACRQAELALRVAYRSSWREVTSLGAVMKDVGQRILEIVDPDGVDTVYEVVLRRMAQLVGGEEVKTALAFLSRGRLSIDPKHTFNYDQEKIQKGGWSWPISKGVTGRAVKDRKSRLVSDVREDPVYFESDPDALCELATPLMRDEKVIGVIDIVSPIVGAITLHHQEAVEAMAEQVVQALSRAEAISASQLAERQLEVFKRTNKRIQEMLAEKYVGELRQRRDKALRELLQAAMNVTDSEYGAIVGAVQLEIRREAWMVADDHTELAVILHEPSDLCLNSPDHWPAGKGITGEAFSTGKPIAKSVVEAQSYVALFGTEREICSNLAVPIRSGSESLGVIDVESKHPHTYSSKQINEVKLLATQAANILMAAQLRLAQSQLRWLNDLQLDILDQELSADGDLISADLQQCIMETALKLTGKEKGFAALWFAHGKQFHLHAFYPRQRTETLKNYLKTYKEALREKTLDDMPTPPLPVALAIETQRPILALNLDEPPWQTGEARHHRRAQSSLVVPLLNQDRNTSGPAHVIGALCVESPTPLDFTHYDTKMLMLLAQEIVYAIRAHDLARRNISLVQNISYMLEPVRYPLQAKVKRLEKELASSSKTEDIGDIIQEIAHLTELQGNVLGWIASGNDDSTIVREICLTELVADFAQKMQHFAENKRKRITVELSEDVRAKCSPEQISFALFLLTLNALHYSAEEDTIKLRVVPIQESDSARIEVVDGGEPVTEGDRDFLFEPGPVGGATASTVNPNAPFSVRFGLDHVRRIVNIVHQGKAEYRRREEGNVFLIELPCRLQPDD